MVPLGVCGHTARPQLPSLETDATMLRESLSCVAAVSPTSRSRSNHARSSNLPPVILLHCPRKCALWGRVHSNASSFRATDKNQSSLLIFVNTSSTTLERSFLRFNTRCAVWQRP